jgi:hypothetical protein
VSAPTIEGAGTIGTTVTGTTGTWNVDAADLEFAYQWTSNGAPISGATGSTFSIPSSLFGTTLGLTVTATFGDDAPVSANAAPVTVTGTDGSPNLVNTAVPIVTGTVQIGSIVTASTGAFNVPIGDVALAYQWYLDGVAVDGATASTFTIPNVAIGKALTVKVTGTVGSQSASGTSVAVAIGGSNGTPTVTNLTAPVVTGSAVTGKTLTVSSGTWNVPNADLTLGYQWYANGLPIAGATGTSYKLGASTYNKSIQAVVTASIGTATPTSVLTTAVTVKASSTTTFTFKDATITTKQKAVVKVVVKATGSAPETGKVVVHYGSKTKTVTLEKSDKGKVNVTLPKLKKNSYKVYVEYKGSSTVVGDTSVKKTLKVRKA